MENFKKIYLALDVLNILLISVNILFGVAGYLNEDYMSSCFNFFAAGFIAAITMISLTEKYKK
jgi:hypothetical protein